MGMTCYLRKVDSETFDCLLVDSEGIGELMDFWDGEADDDSTSLDLDKSWHGIHFLLTGTASEAPGPAGFLFSGGTEIGGDGYGLGPPRGFNAQQTSELADAILRATPDVLAARYDPVKMDADEVYPEIWVRDGREGLDYLLTYYDELREFIAVAAQERAALLVFLL